MAEKKRLVLKLFANGGLWMPHARDNRSLSTEGSSNLSNVAVELNILGGRPALEQSSASSQIHELNPVFLNPYGSDCNEMLQHRLHRSARPCDQQAGCAGSLLVAGPY